MAMAARKSYSSAAAEDLENPKTAWQGLWRRSSHELNIHCYLIWNQLLRCFCCGR